MVWIPIITDLERFQIKKYITSLNKSLIHQMSSFSQAQFTLQLYTFTDFIYLLDYYIVFQINLIVKVIVFHSLVFNYCVFLILPT